jgi:hypothetical protein
MRAGTSHLPCAPPGFRVLSESAAPSTIRVSTEEHGRRRSPIGFMEALARRLARRRGSTADLPFRYVFVIAYARSGSTRLYEALATIDGFYPTSENAAALHGLFFAYQSACRARDEQPREARDEPATPPPGQRVDPLEGEDGEAGDTASPATRFDPDHYARTLAQAFVDELVQPPARARLIGFHEMRYFDRLEVFDEYVRFLSTAFAPALVVFNKRAPSAVARTGAWRSYPEDTVVTELERFDTRAATYAAAHPSQAIVMDYDAYSRDPSALRPLFERLGVPFHEDAVRTIVTTPLDP